MNYAYAPSPERMPLEEPREPLPEAPSVIIIDGWSTYDTSVEDEEVVPPRTAARPPHTLQT